jgi:hypothetical protein
MWLAAVPLIGGPDPLGGAAAVPSGPGMTTTVTVAAPDGDVRGTLTVTTTGSDDLAVLSGKGVGGEQGGDSADSASGSGSDEAGAGLPELVLPPDPASTETIPVTVPAGSQRGITIARGGGKAATGLTTVSWRSDPGSGPAAVSHVALDDAVPLATGYPWWPVASSVTAVTVREDLGILAPAG